MDRSKNKTFQIILCFLFQEWNFDLPNPKQMIDHWNKFYRKEIESGEIKNHSYGCGCDFCYIKDNWFEDVNEIIDYYVKWKNNNNIDNNNVLIEIIAIILLTSDDYWDEHHMIGYRFKQWEDVSDTIKQKYIKQSTDLINYYN